MCNYRFAARFNKLMSRQDYKYCGQPINWRYPRNFIRITQLLILASAFSGSSGCGTDRTANWINERSVYNGAQEKARRECLNRANSADIPQCMSNAESFEDYKARRGKLQKGDTNGASD